MSSTDSLPSEQLFVKSDTNSSMFGVQILSSLLLFILTFAVGTLPVVFLRIWNRREQTRLGERSKNSSLVLQLLMFFGGGVLLAISFVHLIPEVQESWEDYEAEHHHNSTDRGTSVPEASHKHHKVPFIELAICCGFFLIYFIEEAMFFVIGHDHHGHHHGEQILDPIIGQTACDCAHPEDSRSHSQNESKYGSVNSPPPLSNSMNPDMATRDQDFGRNASNSNTGNQAKYKYFRLCYFTRSVNLS